MAFGEDLILRTRLQPPRLRRWTLPRARLLSRLEQATEYRLTVLEAPTGYGKSTLLASWLDSSNHPYAWYNLSQSDLDPFIFLLHLIYAFRHSPRQPVPLPCVGERALEALEREWTEARSTAERRVAYRSALHLFINELCATLEQDTFLILDDFHLIVRQAGVLAVAEEIIAAAPPQLHIIISSRTHPELDSFSRWQVQKELLSLVKEELTFTPAETAQLFEECYGYHLGEGQAARLSTETEGWIIALQMVWQNLQGANAMPLETIFKDLPQNLTGLFDYLAHEVLSRQEQDVQNFLMDSAVLRRMNTATCDFVLERAPGESARMLRQLSENGLFVIAQGEEEGRATYYRYHHLFGKFLYSRLQKDAAHAIYLHQRAARFYCEHNSPEEAVHHLQEAHEWDAAADLLESGLGMRLLETGQLERLEYWLSAFSPESLSSRPALLVLQGDCLRLTSRFEEALRSYRQAITRYEETNQQREGLVRALRGRAMVYLDTVQPTSAEEWLERAVEVAEGTGNRQLSALLLRDLAENKLNRGRPLEAEELHRQARQLLGEPENGKPSDARIWLRSGRLDKAIELLENTPEIGGRANNDSHPRPPRRAGRSHREGLLVLSFLNSLKGEKEKAITCAEQGIFLARELRTPFTEAVAWQRLGHALLVSGAYDKALDAYEHGLKLADKLGVPRLRVEGLIGKGLLYGRSKDGKLALARQVIEEGIQVARRSGDEWIEGFLLISLASALTTNGESMEAVGVAQAARAAMENCGDRFGLTLARLWGAIASENSEELIAIRAECKQQNYMFLWERPTLFGPEGFAPATYKLATPVKLPPISSPKLKPEKLTRLQITTLGVFAVKRVDGTELTARDWAREKARQLFQLLLTRRDKPLTKDQILEYLWPESDYISAESRFKVALNALVRALEPERSSRTQSSYIVRSGSGSGLAYTLALDPALVWFDAVEFEKLAALGTHAELNEGKSDSAALEYYEKALELYRGDFLPGCMYEDWAAAERERLLTLFLTTAERLTRLMVTQQEWERCLSVCRLILARDNCWEEAYRLMMLAYWKQGNRTAALRTYEKCTATLSEELGVEPMPQTLKLYNEILLD